MTRNGNAIQLLTYAFAAMDHGSLRQAARALRVQESSVSRNVVKLEQLLDMQLFERDVRGVRLTKTGRAWIENGAGSLRRPARCFRRGCAR
ncbi:LysR family transcriptional regulator [Mesorhizobium sp. B2-5-13]|nr:LysR family transcriptional regulator [Mesorhizobium sp. B2-5-13]TPK52352.1 LysR family transcriptional regulator [Mesorhizobium sp. B2-5-5]